jgi:DNA mismatch repair protein MutS
VARRAEILLKAAEREMNSAAPLPLFATPPPPPSAADAQVAEALAALELDLMTPREALAALYDLRGKLMAHPDKAG